MIMSSASVFNFFWGDILKTKTNGFWGALTDTLSKTGALIVSAAPAGHRNTSEFV